MNAVICNISSKDEEKLRIMGCMRALDGCRLKYMLKWRVQLLLESSGQEAEGKGVIDSF